MRPGLDVAAPYGGPRIETCWRLLHPLTGITLGFEWVRRNATDVMPPPPDFFNVPPVRVLERVQ